MDAYSELTRIYGMENITTEEFMSKIDMFQARFLKGDEFVWWYLKLILTDADTHFTS